MIMHGIDVVTTAEQVTTELGAWMLSELNAAGLRDAVHDVAGPVFQALSADERADVMAAIEALIYG
jgi:hypothetical protein